MKTYSFRLGTDDQKLVEHLEKKNNVSEYLKQLIKKDLEQQTKPATQPTSNKPSITIKELLDQIDLIKDKIDNLEKSFDSSLDDMASKLISGLTNI